MAIAGKYAAAASLKAVRAKDTPFDQGGAAYRAKAAAHGITAETRIMPPTAMPWLRARLRNGSRSGWMRPNLP